MANLKGQLLVASPHLKDPNFSKTVVLMIHHSDEGAFGVVLNRPADNTIKDLWEQVGETPCESDRRVNVGGPVAGPLMAIHTDRKLAEMEILPGLYFAAQRDHLEKLLVRPDHQYRIFVGHSGWGGGQLESELKEGAWLTTPATVDTVFADDAELWNRAKQHIGESLLGSALGIKHVPDDPSMN
ncbi:MAG: YqgE/AlgH family protein [Planctomycetota bacterium]|jgi:putative transcriptional regulator